ncbi:AAA family ATPase [Ensifer adhaerens]
MMKHDVTKAAVEPENTYTGRIISKPLSEYELESIQWLWPGHFALGKQTYIQGWPEAGKGMVLVSVAAAITTGGSFPDGQKAKKGRIIWFSAEESASDTLKPRLLNAGGDPALVEVIEAVQSPKDTDVQKAFDLRSNLSDLEELITHMGDVVAVIFDPITSYIPGNQNDKGNMRSVLDPLTKVAERTGVAVFGVVHDRKTVDDSNARAASLMSGSGALWEIPRAVFMVRHSDPDDMDSERQFISTKFNLPGGRPSSLGFVTTKAFVQDVQTVGIEWQGEIAVRAEATVREMSNGCGGRPSRKLDEAMKFLQDILADGVAMAAVEVEQVAEERGIALKTLRRAKSELGVESFQEEKAWFWELHT